MGILEKTLKRLEAEHGEMNQEKLHSIAEGLYDLFSTKEKNEQNAFLLKELIESNHAILERLNSTFEENVKLRELMIQMNEHKDKKEKEMHEMMMQTHKEDMKSKDTLKQSILDIVPAIDVLSAKMDVLTSSPQESNSALISEIKNTNSLLQELIDKEPVIVGEQKQNVLLRAKEKPRWIIVDNYNLSNLIGSFDGSNQDFFLPSVPIKNSESIRLNQGSPLSHGEDYTLTGNKLSFTQVYPSESKVEIRYQTR